MVTLKSYAKLNLYLAILGTRSDSFHELYTLFERISLYDTISLISRRDSRIVIETHSPHIPTDETNLAYKSAVLLRRSSGITKGVTIRITKRIPVGSGMGGGSSNAAAVLMGLTKLWRVSMRQTELMDLGRELGSDVPFFLCGKPYAIGTQRGDVVEPVDLLHRIKLWHVIAVPELHVSTPDIYKRWDIVPSLGGTLSLTKARKDVSILIRAVKRKNCQRAGRMLFNALEPVTVSLYPEVLRSHQAFAASGAEAVRQSGSGPTVFGIYSERNETLRSARCLIRQHVGRVFVAHTV